MFKKTIVSALVFGAALASAQANAAFVTTDWKSSGDALATLDTDTGLEWLDLAVTKGMSYSDVSALTQTTLKGWRFPTASEVHSMMSHFFASLSSWPELKEYFVHKKDLKAEALPFQSYLGTTSSDTGYSNSQFIYREGGVSYIDIVSVRTAQNMDGLLHSSIATYNESWSSSTYSYILVSDGGTTLSSINNPALNINNPNAPVHQTPDTPADVPVHAGFGLLGLLLLAFGSRRKERV